MILTTLLVLAQAQFAVRWTPVPGDSVTHAAAFYKVGLAVTVPGAPTRYIEHIRAAPQVQDTFALNWPRDTVWASVGSPRDTVQYARNFALAPDTVPLVGDSIRVQAYVWSLGPDSSQSRTLRNASGLFWVTNPVAPPVDLAPPLAPDSAFLTRLDTVTVGAVLFDVDLPTWRGASQSVPSIVDTAAVCLDSALTVARAGLPKGRLRT